MFYMKYYIRYRNYIRYFLFCIIDVFRLLNRMKLLDMEEINLFLK